ncbi:MAG: glycosyltransferase [Cryomorphaceae bacterium]|nr:glycosyltransferase [Cryomorphaceae bacterium]
MRSDANHNPGGDVVQVNSTATELRKRGFLVDVVSHEKVLNWSQYQLIQAFNLGRPAEILPALNRGIPVFIFSIWVDFHIMDLASPNLIRRFIARVFGKFGAEYIKTFGRYFKGQIPFPGWRYLFLGQKRSMQMALNACSGLIASTENELHRLRQEGLLIPPNYFVNPLGVAMHFFRTNKEVGNGVFFAGYIEPRKGVLPLIKICNKRRWPLHIFGKASVRNVAYEKECRKVAGDSVVFYGHQPQLKMIEVMRKCKVVALPSFFETTGLSALEGAVMGKSIVVGEGGDTRSVFGDYAFYCKPQNIESIEIAIEKALLQDVTKSQIEYFSQFSITRHVDELTKHYQAYFEK